MLRFKKKWPDPGLVVGSRPRAGRRQPQAQVVEVTRVVTETIVEEGQPIEVTRVVTEVQEVVATPEPDVQSPAGRPTQRPGARYPSASRTRLIRRSTMRPPAAMRHSERHGAAGYLRPRQPDRFVPVLAVEVPTVDNGGISEDGQTYVQHSRRRHLPRRRHAGALMTWPTPSSAACCRATPTTRGSCWSRSRAIPPAT